MAEAFICDYIRTPIGRYGGALAMVRTDDLAAVPLRALGLRHPGLDWAAVDEVILGCANQAGEDNRNIARMALLLAGLPPSVPGCTINRLCASGMDAVLAAARMIRSGEADLILAGGVESMTRAPFVVPKPDSAFARTPKMYDTTIGWRMVNPAMVAAYGTDQMPETAENVAQDFAVSRADQDGFALRSQMLAATAQQTGRLAQEIAPVTIPQHKREPLVVTQDEHPRATTAEALARLPAPFRRGASGGASGGASTGGSAGASAARCAGGSVTAGSVTAGSVTAGSVTAGNSSGVNDGAAALILASAAGVARHGLTPLARVVGGAAAGVAPRIMGIGPVPAAQRLLARLGWDLASLDVIELNEAFASQSLATLRLLGIADDDPRVNRHGGAIALGHPLGMTGARITGTAALDLALTGGGRALAMMCVGVGQGVAVALERP